MAMILDAFMSKFNEVLVQMVQDEVGKLLGVPGEIEKLERTVRDIHCLIADAEKQHIQSMSIKNWLVELKDVMYDADDIMDLCQIMAEEKRDCSNSPSSSKFRRLTYHLFSHFRKPFFAHQIGTKIKEINLRLEEIAKRKSDLGLNATTIIGGPSPVGREDPVNSRQTDSSVVIEDLVGKKIEEDAVDLISWLIEEKTDVRGNIGIVAVVGMGGIGKTTLAKRIYNDSKIDDKFKLKIWACVFKEVKEKDLLACIIREAGGAPGADQAISELVKLLGTVIKGKKFFLVLDDVWPKSVAVWNNRLRALMSGGADGSRLLITTRNDSVANDTRATHSHRVEKMSEEDGWSLLIKQVFQDEKESDGFKDIGLQLVRKCDGLPLGIKSIGGVLRMKKKPIRDEWEAVLRSDLWSMDGMSKEFPQAFYLSYEDLPPYLKPCFILCSLYPEDYLFHKDSLIHLWCAEGFLQGNENISWYKLGQQCYNELMIRNLLEDSGRYYDNAECKMHDLLRSFAHRLGKDENYYIITEGKNLNRQEYVAKLRRLSIEENKGNLEDVIKEKGLRTLFIGHLPENSLHLWIYAQAFQTFVSYR